MRGGRIRLLTGTGRSVDRIRYLIELSAEGDDEAARALIQLAQPAVRRLCAALGSGDDVEDLVQDTFLRTFRSISTYRGDGDGFVPWVLAIARNACATEVGRRNRRRTLMERLHTVSPGDTVYTLPEMSTTDSLLAGLPTDQREAFVLTQLLALSYQEAASVCGCPVGTVRSRVARARASLMAQLERDCG